MARPPAKKPDVFWAIRNGNVRAATGLRRDRNNNVQRIDAVVYDGDTIQVDLNGSGSLRFLGIDTAELKLNGQALNHPNLVARFADAGILDIPGMDLGLHAHLAARIGPRTAENQHDHAVQGQRSLQAMVEADMQALAQTPETFSVFLEFSYEVFDRHGRFLVFVNRNQKQTEDGGRRPLSYNERMLEAGMSLPFFIWPNIAPFREFETIIDAVPLPGSLASLAQKSKLGAARRMVKTARDRTQPGDSTVFDPANPLILEGFELRFLQGKRLPNRGVIDLGRKTSTILRPQNYWKIPLPEDRLFIPPEFIPAFAARGWKLEGW